MDQDRPRLTRRRLRQLGVAWPPPTPACDDGDDRQGSFTFVLEV